MQNLERGVLQGKTTSNLVDCIYLLTEQLHIKVGRMRRRLCFVRAPEVLFVVRVLEGRGLGTLEGMLETPSLTLQHFSFVWQASDMVVVISFTGVSNYKGRYL